MTFRKVLFWTHLISGCIAGVIILIMSVTGVLLTYEKQMIARADRGAFQSQPTPANLPRLDIDALLDQIEAQDPAALREANVVIRSNPAEPIELAIGREGSLYADPYSGHILGRSNPETRRTFQKITAWHRWLGVEGEGRATARAITGACNLAFLVLVVTGAYLWLPKLFTRQHLRPIVWFRGNLSAKARDFNWHNVFGVWAFVPLLIVVASGLPMSYSWANNLIYKLTGSELPEAGGPRRPPPQRGERPRNAAHAPRKPVRILLAQAVRQTPDWQSISFRPPSENARVTVFTIDAGNGGQPQKRGTLTLENESGLVRKWETFDSLSAGRQWRTWSRFAHTGEYYGIIGQTIAGLASFAGAMLVWTGISLSLRRFSAWRARRTRQPANALS